MDYKISSCKSSAVGFPEFFGQKVLTPLELVPLLKRHREGKLTINLEGVTLEGDFTGLDLSGLNLRNATLTKANLSFTNLSNSDLTDVNADGAVFTHAIFYKTVLRGAHLCQADLRDTMLIKTDLTGASCKGTLFHNATLSWARVIRADCSGADFTGATLNRVTIKHSIFTNAIFLASNVKQCDIQDCKDFCTEKEALSKTNDRKTFKDTLKQADFKSPHPVIFQLSGDLRGKKFKALTSFLNQTCSSCCILKFNNATLGPQEMKILLKLRQAGKLLLNFSRVAFAGDFTGQIFFGLNLANADIGVKRETKVEFRNARFIGCNLDGASAAGGNLAKATFRYSEISGMNFFLAKMPQAVMADCIAIGNVQLCSVQMQNADFQNSEFVDARFGSAKLGGSTFEGTKIRRSSFMQSSLDNTCWQGAVLDNTDIEKSSVKRANLKGLQFSGGDLMGTTLAGSVIDHATKFSNVFVVGTHFDDLTGSVVPENWTLSWIPHSQHSARSQDRPQHERFDLFDHATNRESGSVLSAIESLPTAFKPVQQYLFHQVINYFHEQGEDIEKQAYTRLADILLEAFSPHDEDSRIRDALQKHIYPLYIHRFHSSLQFYNHLIDEKEALAKFNMMARFLLAGLDPKKYKDSAPKERLILIQNECYLMANLNCYHARLSARLSPEHNGRFDTIKQHWDDLVRSGVVMEGVDDASEYFCFIRVDSATGLSQAVLIDHQHFPQFCDVEDTTKRVIPIICLNTQEGSWAFTDDRPEVLKSFPSVLSRLRQLEAGYALMPLFEKLIPEDIRPHFLDGMKVQSRAKSLFLNVGDADYLALEAWGKTICNDLATQSLLKSMEETAEEAPGTQEQADIRAAARKVRIDAAAKEISLTVGCAQVLHETISELVHSSDEVAQKEERLFLLLNVLQMMCYFSSTHMFGSESMSPLPIRFFALALLNYAKKEAEILPENSLCKSLLRVNYATWVARLAGTGSSCTAILSGDIKEEMKKLCVKNQALTQLYCLVMPELWR